MQLTRVVPTACQQRAVKQPMYSAVGKHIEAKADLMDSAVASIFYVHETHRLIGPGGCVSTIELLALSLLVAYCCDTAEEVKHLLVDINLKFSIR